MPRTLRIGIIGTGGMARYHATMFKEIPGVELTACLDVIPGKAQEFCTGTGTKQVAADLDDLLAKVDAVSVVTPDRFHAAPTIAALKAGKHTLCEKPLTVTLEEARQVAACAKQASGRGIIHMVNFSYRRSAAFQHAIGMHQKQALGELRHVHSHYLQSWLAQGQWGSWTSDSMLWRLQTAKGSGGVLGDLGCHILDLTTAVSGEVQRIRCHLATFPKLLKGKSYTVYKGAKLDANDTAMIELEFDNGATGLVQTSRWTTGHANHLRCEVHGTRGAMRFDLDTDQDAIDLFQGRDLAKASWATRKLKPTPTNWQRFISSIRKGRQDQPDILRGAQVQAYLDACERSAKSGAWERIAGLKAAAAR